MAGKLHRYGFIEVDGVRYHVTRCMDHKHCSSTERKTGYKVQEVLEGYASDSNKFIQTGINHNWNRLDCFNSKEALLCLKKNKDEHSFG